MTANGNLVGMLPGCVWDAQLFDAAAVAAQGGVLTGAPTVNRGVTLDGVAQTLIYTTSSAVPLSPALTMCVEFVPGYALDAGTERYFFDTSQNGAWFHPLNVIFVKINSVTLGSIPYATILPFWNHYGVNKLVITGVSGSTQTYLNGNIIDTAGQAWTPVPQSVLSIGSRFDGPFQTAAKTTQLHFHNRKWTQADVDAWQSDSLFTYRNRASLYLPMRAGDVSGTNTLDRSGKGNDAAYGAGAGAPTKLVGSRGYSFDGGDHAELSDVSAADYTDNFSYCALVKPVDAVERGIVSKANEGDTTGSAILWLNSRRFTLVTQHHLTPAISDVVELNKIYHVAGIMRDGVAEIYTDGVLGPTSVAATVTTNTTEPLRIGVLYTDTLASPFLGDVYHIATYPIALSPLQIAIERRRLMAELHGDI